MVAFFRGIAQLVARQFWELDAASSSLATPTYKRKDQYDSARSSLVY